MNHRLMYLPNEQVLGGQRGPRAAVEAMTASGRLGGHVFVSLLPEIKRLGTRRAALDFMHAAAEDFQPTAVLISHPVGTGIEQADLRRLRNLASRPTIGYYEADPYSRFRQPLPVEARMCAGECDVVWTVGSGEFERLLRSHGATEVRYSGHRRDEGRFPIRTDPPTNPTYDVVAIANRNRSVKPWRRLPGSHERARLLGQLSRDLGTRLAIYGSGWRLVSAVGRCNYDDQQAVLRTGRLSVNWDHFPREPYYFSDRLPISLSAGVPHVTTWHPGYGSLFPAAADNGLFLEASIGLVRRRVHELLSRPQEELEALGSRAAELSRDLGQGPETQRIISELIAWRA